MRIVRTAFFLTVYVARASRNSRSASATCSSAFSPEHVSGSGEGQRSNRRRETNTMNLKQKSVPTYRSYLVLATPSPTVGPGFGGQAARPALLCLPESQCRQGHLLHIQEESPHLEAGEAATGHVWQPWQISWAARRVSCDKGGAEGGGDQDRDGAWRASSLLPFVLSHFTGLRAVIARLREEGECRCISILLTPVSIFWPIRWLLRRMFSPVLEKGTDSVGSSSMRTHADTVILARMR